MQVYSAAQCRFPLDVATVNMVNHPKNSHNARNGDRIGNMKSEFRLLQQVVRFDREATIALYRDTITVPGADKCGCIYCKNFAGQRSKLYPEEFLRLLSELGGDPRKEWEAFDYDFKPENSSNHLNGGWFLFCGELIKGVHKRPDQGQTAFAYWFTTSFPTGALPRDARFCAVEFSIQVPWILLEAPK